MLIVTLHENAKLIGTLRIRRISGEPEEGLNNDYEVWWKPGAAEVGTVQRAWVMEFDRKRKELALAVEAVKALGLE